MRLASRCRCALVGAELPPADEGGEPFRIKLGQLRGVESQGMLCSARELKLSEDHGGLLLLTDDAPVGADIRAHCCKLDDTLFTLKLTPNLAHALSVYGIAREVVGADRCAAEDAGVRAGAHRRIDDRLPVRVEAPDLCGRFSGRVVRGVEHHGARRRRGWSSAWRAAASAR